MNHREELEALVELARLGNMRQAAERLGIAQSTLSECVTRLETLYGASLFERGRRGSQATVYGRIVIEAAERALRVMREAEREIGLVKGSASGRLAIGGEPGLIEPVLVPAIVQGLAAFPDLRYRVLALDSDTLVQEVRDKRLGASSACVPTPDQRPEIEELGLSGSCPSCARSPLSAAGPLQPRKHALSVVQGPARVSSYVASPTNSAWKWAAPTVAGRGHRQRLRRRRAIVRRPTD